MDIASLYSLYKLCEGVTTDTRTVRPGTMFFALKGANFNGNLFAQEALSKGASYAVVDEDVATDSRIIKTADVLTTLQQLALHHRRRFSGKVIALTGSNGKTTTKELIATVLAAKYTVQATKGNLNNHIGIPLTLLSMPTDLAFAVIEMGANHQKEIEQYCQYTEPDYGLITNVGLAHIEGFGGFEGVIKGKTELYRYLASARGLLFLNADNEILVNKADEAGFTHEQLITYGVGDSTFCKGKLLGGEFLGIETDGVTINTHLVGNYNFENVLAACCIGKYFGLTPQQLKTSLETYVPANNRSQQIELNGNSIILDCYNANPSSMKAAIENFAAKNSSYKMVILGGMKELGNESKAEHERIAHLALEAPFDKRIFIGSEFTFMQDKALHFDTTAAAKEWLSINMPKGISILVKGSRAYALEQLFS